MHDISTPNADEMYYNELARKVRFHKQDEMGVQMASQIVEEYGDERAAEALQKGIEQGLQQKAVEDATNLLKLNKLTVEQISSTIGLPLEKVNELKKQLLAQA